MSENLFGLVVVSVFLSNYLPYKVNFCSDRVILRLPVNIYFMCLIGFFRQRSELITSEMSLGVAKTLEKAQPRASLPLDVPLLSPTSGL